MNDLDRVGWGDVAWLRREAREALRRDQWGRHASIGVRLAELEGVFDESPVKLMLIPGQTARVLNPTGLHVAWAAALRDKVRSMTWSLDERPCEGMWAIDFVRHWHVLISLTWGESTFGGPAIGFESAFQPMWAEAFYAEGWRFIQRAWVSPPIEVVAGPPDWAVVFALGPWRHRAHETLITPTQRPRVVKTLTLPKVPEALTLRVTRHE